jgi:hypothetical protein
MARRKRSRAPKLVLVHWKDAAGDRYGDDLTPPNCLTVGWVIEINDEYIKLASELIESGEYLEVTVIPKGMIQSIDGKPFRLPAEFSGWEAR